MAGDIQVPDEIGVMTLPGATLFPQALLPLHIFEPRYRLMLKETLEAHRVFAVAGVDTGAGGGFEPPFRVAGIGIIRASQTAADGTSNLLLQGIGRVEIVEVLREAPYRRIRVKRLEPTGGDFSGETAEGLRLAITRLIARQGRLEGAGARDILKLLETFEDPGTFADIAAANACEDPKARQQLLEILPIADRLRFLRDHLRREVDALSLRKRLQGALGDDDIGAN